MAKRTWEKNNPDKVRACARATRARRQAWINGLKAVPCMDCHQMFPSVCMDFDHVRGEKLFTIGGQGMTNRPALVEAEIAKCDIVCANCHRIRTHIHRRGKS